jgi:hypothetical protein
LTILNTLLSRGFFPKELPPAFSTEQIGKFARSQKGRLLLSNYKPLDSYTECIQYSLARPGGDRRELKIPHPATFYNLAVLASKHMSRLLQKSGTSKFSRSRPVYTPGASRAIGTRSRFNRLTRERAYSRSGASYLLRTDVSHFYPSLYTHAVGWAIDPKLRLKSNWKNSKLLGKKVDQALMNIDGKMSQGIPIGNDVSFLLAEIVLSQVDRKLNIFPERAFRWFDDYEMAFDTRAEAELALRELTIELRKFRLRLNPKKTTISPLPSPIGDEWQTRLFEAGKKKFDKAEQIIDYFDLAFRLRDDYPDAAVLSYALGRLFSIHSPSTTVCKVAQSFITQAILAEPGAAQKAFALLSFWVLNGVGLDVALIAHTVNLVISRHENSGVSSDVAWALAFSIEQNLTIEKTAAQVLARSEDDCTLIQSLHLYAKGQIPKGFNLKTIEKLVKTAHLDREHWLVAYESTRQGFLTASKPIIAVNDLFSELLSQKVAFYEQQPFPYSTITHSGSAPDWLINKWHTQAKLFSDSNVFEEKYKTNPIIRAMNEGFDLSDQLEENAYEEISDELDQGEYTSDEISDGSFST